MDVRAVELLAKFGPAVGCGSVVGYDGHCSWVCSPGRSRRRVGGWEGGALDCCSDGGEVFSRCVVGSTDAFGSPHALGENLDSAAEGEVGRACRSASTAPDDGRREIVGRAREPRKLVWCEVFESVLDDNFREGVE